MRRFSILHQCTFNMTSSLKATRPDRLTENETLTSVEDWRNQLEFFLRQDKDLAEFLDPNCT